VSADAANIAYIDLCPLAALPPNAARGFDPFGHGHDSLFLVRSNGAIHAYRNWCPHQGSTMPWRKNAYLNADASRIVCSAHGAEFDIKTGRCTAGAALGSSLEPVRIRIGDNGRIRARVSDLPDARDKALPDC
jgi:naringenin degradation protein FdeD